MRKVKNVKVKVLVTQSCLTLCNPMDCLWDSPGKKNWRGLPVASPGNLPNPGIEPGCPALQTDALPSEISPKTITSFKVNIHQSNPQPLCHAL